MSNPEVEAVKVFVIRNQDNRYLTKKHQWRSGNNSNELYRAKERDVGLNELIEVNAKDIMARLELVECELSSQRQPVVEVLADDPPEAMEEAQLELGEEQSEEAVPQAPHLELVKSDTASESLSPAS